MLVLRYRQLFIPLLTVPLLAVSLFANDPDPKVLEATRELQAAKLLEATLAAKGATDQEWAKMDAIYADLTRRYPGEPALLLAHAEMLSERGAHDRAEALLREALKLDPKSAPVLFQLGVCALANGHTKEAASFYRQAVAAAPETARYHHNLANLLYLFRHELLDLQHADAEALITRAMEHYAAAARLEPQNAEYAKSYAETFFGVAKPDWDTAAKAWESYIAISANKDFGYANLARVFMKAGKKAEAREALNKMTTAEFAPLRKRLSERVEQE
jgi:tetratricopeptide (TPR) repeat protein